MQSGLGFRCGITATACMLVSRSLFERVSLLGAAGNLCVHHRKPATRSDIFTYRVRRLVKALLCALRIGVKSLLGTASTPVSVRIQNHLSNPSFRCLATGLVVSSPARLVEPSEGEFFWQLGLPNDIHSCS